ncbi:polysaccharide deacetylase family sporulation protein PdaB [Pseudalkalibacillus berkeleyi]|uniref:Polysaccharide deacetylase family sporulation protein PdaB n=1 Tax=Pseudalkalibacillus berkeleyi TaxID=1069813 RepID=A0ABS9H6L4_9BACL|nr:polysaccharide deacetylase family sporulation protein PdaB [Pseudalkalibacillus berkeleyi]MCF6139433.1 polysaccharide deacetylase family sporulation protein PdaB [Pseudalkalibacillus berkeleyi]
MNFFWIINGKRMKQYLIILIASFFAALIAFVESKNLEVFKTKDGEPRAIYQGEEKGKKIALTFDVSWGEKRIHEILDLLERENINDTTFFISGEWAERHPDIVEKIVKNGHEIGSLGYRYKSYTELEDAQIRKDITRAQQVIEALTGKPTRLLRPPNGAFNKTVLEIAEKLNHTIVQWSIDPNDWKNPGADQITETVISEANGGDIVLLHASDSVKQTKDALKDILDQLRSDHYTFSTVGELIANTDTKRKEIK